MKVRIPIQQLRVGDVDPKTGKKVAEVLQRFDVMVGRIYIRGVLEGGWPLIDGYQGKMVEVERS